MRVSWQKAEEIATRGWQEKAARSSQLRHFHFAAPRLHAEEDRCFVFAAPSEEMEAAGYAPAALFVYVDKSDGHLWDNEEQKAYFYATAKQAQPERIAA
jgi:hypothetical protein